MNHPKKMNIPIHLLSMRGNNLLALSTLSSTIKNEQINPSKHTLQNFYIILVLHQTNL